MPERTASTLESSQVQPLFIDSVRDCARLLLDPNGNVASWNQGAQLIKGYAADEIIGRHFSCFSPPEDVAAGKPQLRLERAAAAGRFEDIGYRVRKNGSHFLANVILTAVRGPGGELLGYGKVTRDITGRFTIEERVGTIERRLRTLIDTLFDTVVDGLITTNLRGQIQSFNKACVHLFGYTAEEVLGANVSMLMPEPDRDRHDGYLSKYIATGRAAIIGIGREVFGRRKDGSVFPMRLAVGENHDGGEHAFVGIIHDLSEQRRDRDRLRNSEAQFRCLFDTNPVGMWLATADEHRFVRVNQAFCRMLDYAPEELIGRSHDDIADPAHRFASPLVAPGERPAFTAEQRFITKSGKAILARVGAWRISSEAEDRALVLGLAEDVTERQQIEERLRQGQRMEAVGHLTGGLAHNFNNLLSVIVGNVELLHESLQERPEELDLCNEILQSASRGADLTRRLLGFVRHQMLQPTTVELNTYVQQHVMLLQRILGEAIVVLANLTPGLWPTYTDVSQVGDALLNLALNARDAMPSGGRLTIETANTHIGEDSAAQMVEVIPGDYVMLSVTDTGCGMQPDVIARACEPFFSTQHPSAGAGLGLSMIYGFAKQSGGHLKITSEIGIGTTVCLYLPRSVSVATCAVEAEVEGMALARGIESILLVDDNAEMRDVGARSLSALGYMVRVAKNGPEAREILRSGEPFDLLFTDVIMPEGMTGYQLAEAARQLRPGIAVLFTTGYADERHDVEKRRDTLYKPYRRHQLAEKVRAALTPPD